MPRIRAATVAEHRKAQRAALLDAARSILAEEPARPPTLTEVAARAGLARTGIYQYFASRDELLTALLADTFPRWSQRVTERMATAGAPSERVLEYVRANLDLVAEGEHALARVLTTIIHDDIAAYSRTLHDDLRDPLVRALTDGGATDPDATAELIDAIVRAASRMIENGHDPAATASRATELITPYLTALPGREPAR